ncbi:hypothetical protein DL770_004174 [Monosporascus sp. CRB-9-2]|nr:hypothetical protein DL770_004174 [Monosporascus sp. CRB-9-2]
MDTLDRILNSYVVSPGEKDVKNKLLAAGFVVVDKNVGILYSRAAGRLGFEPTSPAYTVESMSWIASMTKLITATCMLQLVEAGLIALDDDIRPKVPQLGSLQILRGFDRDDKPILQENTKPMTLRHLLSHTLGIGVDTADPDLIKWSKSTGRTTKYTDWTLEGIMTPLKFAPGEGWYYGVAYDWAGHLLTILTGQALGAYMRENVFEPLGMASTTFWPRSIGDFEQRALAFQVRDANNGTLKPGDPPIPEDHPMEAGGSGLFSTPADYAKLLQGLLAHRLLRPSTTDLLFAPQLNPAQQGILMAIADYYRDAFAPEIPRAAALDHGLGGLLSMQDVEGKRRRGSLMWSGMTNGRWWIDRETGVAGAMLVQVLPHGDPVATAMYDELERAVYGELLTNPAK